MIYFNIYLKDEENYLFYKTLYSINLNKIGLELYELKRLITKIDSEFSDFCITHSGSYQLFISTTNPKELKGVN